MNDTIARKSAFDPNRIALDAQAWKSNLDHCRAFAWPATKPGYYEHPFIYVLDVSGYGGSGLTSGRDYDNLRIALDGDAVFVARAVLVATSILNSSVNSGLYWYNNEGQNVVKTFDFNTTTRQGIRGVNDPIPILPELAYDAGGQIVFGGSNLRSVAHSSAAGGYTYWGFQGVKRFPVGGRVKPSYKRYTLQPFTYRLAIPGFSAAQTYSSGFNFTRYIAINDYDFEWYWSAQIDTSTTTSGDNYNLANGYRLYMIYDAYGRKMMNAPVPDYMVTSSGVRQESVGFVAQMGFPCPGSLYPAGSQIRFDIYNGRDAASTPTYDLIVHGARRIPHV